MTKETIIGAQGEVRIYRVTDIPEAAKPANIPRTPLGTIISHSESGHHHLLSGSCDVFSEPDVVPGMTVFYAIVKDHNARLFQDGPAPHEEYKFENGEMLKFEVDIEFNPFAEEARQSKD